MSFRAGLSSTLFRPLTFRSAQSHLPHLSQRTFSTARSTFARPGRNARLSLSPILFPLALGSSYAAYNILNSPAQCESSSPSIANAFSSAPTPEVGAGNPPPHSELSAYQLGFGAVCGICTGIFVKKGLKAIAFLLGGVFILMQYMSSKRFITVDWSKLAGTYDKTFGSKGPAGEVRPPTVGGVGAWFVDFVTANFQQRATFLAGLALGLRLG